VYNIKTELFKIIYGINNIEQQGHMSLEIICEGETLDNSECVYTKYINTIQTKQTNSITDNGELSTFFYVMKSKPITIQDPSKIDPFTVVDSIPNKHSVVKTVIEKNGNDCKSEHILPLMVDYIQTPTGSFSQKNRNSFDDCIGSPDDISNELLPTKPTDNFYNELRNIYSTLDTYKNGIEDIQHKIKCMLPPYNT